MDQPLPQAMEAEVEFDFLAADDLAHGLHSALAARAFERIAAPNVKNQVAPERAHFAGGLFVRWRDEEEFRLRIRLRQGYDGQVGDFGFRIGRRFGPADDTSGGRRSLATGLVGVDAVVADGLLPFGWQVEEGGGDEVGGFEDFEVALGGVVALGAVNDGLGGGVPGDFLEREGMAEKILGEAFSTGADVSGDGFFAAVVDVEAGVLPGEEVGEFFRADEFGFAQGVEEVVTEEFDGGGEVLGGQAMKAAVGGEETVGGEDVEMGVKDEVVAEGVEGGDGSKFAVGKAEADAEEVAQGIGGGVEEVGEEMAAFAEDAAEDARDGEYELAVGNRMADGGGDPFAGGTDSALMAGWTKVAGFAGEGEEAFVTAVGALEAG